MLVFKRHRLWNKKKKKKIDSVRICRALRIILKSPCAISFNFCHPQVSTMRQVQEINFFDK